MWLLLIRTVKTVAANQDHSLLTVVAVCDDWTLVAWCYVQQSRTFVEEDSNSEAEPDDEHGVDDEEDKYNSWLSVVDNASWTNVDAEENGKKDIVDEQKAEVLGEPGGPVQPALQPHQLHGLLQQAESREEPALPGSMLVVLSGTLFLQ